MDTQRPRVLVLDDQPAMMRYWWNALESSGFEVVRCQNTEEAAREYSAGNFDLIILDRMMPIGEVFKGSDSIVDIGAGETVLSDQRRRGHLKEVPIIIFTSYDDQEVAKRLSDEDPRFRFEHKSTVPTELVRIARQMVERFPVKHVTPEVFDDQHPNTAPYFVRDLATGEPVRMYFDQVGPEEHAFLKPGDAGMWFWASVFEHYIADAQEHRHVSRLLEYNGPGEQEAPLDQAAGVFYNGGHDPQWYRNILFETAPASRRESAKRRYAGVGKALAVRFLRECLYRHGVSENELLLGTHRLEEDQTRMQATRSAGDFLRSLGFIASSSTGVYTIGHDAARRLIRDVTYP